MVENTTIGSSPAPNNPTLQGLLISNGGLIILAVVPIIIGAIRSVKQQQQLEQNNIQNQEGPSNTANDAPHSSSSADSKNAHIDSSCCLFTMADAIRIPFIASGVLFGIYVLFKIFSKEYIVPLISCYFCVLGVLALSQLISPLGNRCVPNFVPNEPYHLILVKGKDISFLSYISMKYILIFL